MTISEFYDIYYDADSVLRQLVTKHSSDVSRVALEVADRHPELPLDRHLLHVGSMLHDFGVFLCDAPGIHCQGVEPYLAHGRAGAAILRTDFGEEIDLEGSISTEALARICERHTGTGLPGYEPQSLEEKIICYADKFFSKSHPEIHRTPEEVVRSLSKFGDTSVSRFLEWHQMFG